MPRHLLGRRHLLGQLRTAAVALALAVPLAACGSGASGSGDDPLEIWIRQTPGSDSDRTAQKLAAAFTKATGVPAKVVALLDDFETKLQQQAARRSLPDIVINDTAQLCTMRTQGWIREVDRAAVAPGWQVFQDAYKDAKYSPPAPNWTPFRQAAADAFNALWADCSADTATAMNRLAETFARELKNQNAAA
ncbi:hypothetical protein [Microbispora sp. CA-102843]|uniref:hypothetical protein n=1 Tax=Microbispora sp. CA-102843 TaxID=3239952 RepID=UPI003D94091D